MKILSLNPNTGLYFYDKDNITTKESKIHLGKYNKIPLFPLYSIDSTKYSYMNINPKIVFNTMLTLNRFFDYYLIEIKYELFINIYEEDFLNFAINKFKEFCKETEEKIDIKSLIKQAQINKQLANGNTR